MKIETIALLLIIPVLVLSGMTLHQPAANAPVSSHLTPAAGASITQVSTSQTRVQATQVWVRSSTSSVYAGSAPTKTYTFNVYPYSTVYSAQTAFLVSAAQGQYARVVVTQGSITLINTTAPSFTVNPLVGNTPLVEKVVLVTNLNGTIPAVGNYPVYTNATGTIQFALFTTAAWSYSQSTFKETLTTYANTSLGWYLNATTLSIPFPSGVPGKLLNSEGHG